jgi:peptidoglycan hydrolase-like protein with peptidoglycan-binding domain
VTATRSRGRGILAAAAALLVLAAAVVGCQAVGADGDGDAEDSSGSANRTATATVTRRDIAEQAELSGTLGYGEQTEITLDSSGVITALPALGAVLDRGATVVEVDGVAVPLWFGERPLWRALDASSADGPDVREVEENLLALGFASADTLTVDDDWTSATTSAVKRWQESLGLDETGSVAPGDVVVLPGPVRVADHPAAIGSRTGGPILAVTGASREVTIDLEATKQALVSVGQPVEVVLPGGTMVAGTIASVGTVAQAGEGSDPLNPSDPTISVVVALDGSEEIAGLDAAPVTVRVTTSAATDVLAVPVDALLALAEGGYAVERETVEGHQLVAVDTGAFASGWVEVTGDLAEGDTVVVPS